MNYKDILISDSDTIISTKGLADIIGKELEVPILLKKHRQYELALEYVIDYILAERPSILPDQTIQYKSWILKFVPNNKKNYTLYEANSIGSKYISGIDTAIEVVSAQGDICVQYDTLLLFTSFNQMIVISDGVYEGLPIQGVRYPSPPHMSGWWLSTDIYDGDIKKMVPVHYHHIAFKRPELLKYLALPYKFRFYHSSDEQEIRYDAAVE